VIEAIEATKTRPLWRLIAALGIRHIGGQSAQILAEHFGSLSALMDAGKEALEDTDQIGPTMAESVYEYFRNEKNRAVIEGLLAAGVKPEQPRIKRTDKLAGKTIVVTGTLDNFTRQQAEQTIRQAGGKASSSVSKKTDFVLAGENAGSKLDKALKLGVKVINEKQFFEIIKS
jgi:DNA ligase (NAD+)